MGEVVPLAPPANENESSPYITGRVRCLHCKHEWQGVAPPGTTNLECTACGLPRGAWIGNFYPADATVWTCGCENTLFLLTATGAPLCIACGCRATSWAEG